MLRILLGIICITFCACVGTTFVTHKPSLYKPEYNRFYSQIAEPYKEEIQSGMDAGVLITDGRDALLHRLALISLAKKSIDIQTYIYKNELTSRLLVNELIRAANRGVKIRILVDDNGIATSLRDIAMLDNHKNIEVRIFNPYSIRIATLKWLESLYDFNRINHRMHNKIFVFDDTALIVGGRNIGDEYFENSDVNFTDMDALFIGNVAKDATKSFEEFWNYKRSIPAKIFTKGKNPTNQDSVIHFYNIDKEQWSVYVKDIESYKQKYMQKKLDLSWGNAIFVADAPSKVDTRGEKIKMPILDLLMYYLYIAKHNAIITSSYLVPDKFILNVLGEMNHKGVNISILTNSLAAIDVIVVYSSWENYRNKLAKMGISVYEYPSYDNKKSTLRHKRFYHSRSHRQSLHAKSMVIDDRISAIGSFNLDYRSILFNTESMVFFHSEAFSKKLSSVIQSQMNRSYHIICDKRCHWQTTNNNQTKQFKTSPNTSIWLRMFKFILKVVPEVFV